MESELPNKPFQSVSKSFIIINICLNKKESNTVEDGPNFTQQIVRKFYKVSSCSHDKNNNNSKSLPDLTVDKSSSSQDQSGTSRIIQETPKSFSSRFVSHIKPDSAKVVRRKKSGLVDNHFEAVICPKHEDSPPPCNCPRHISVPSKSQLSRHRLRPVSTEAKDNILGNN